jgi:hypothetical protein
LEINRFDNVRGVIAMEDVVEGRFIVIVPNTFTNDFGSEADLVGARTPDTADEGKRARYVITWPVSNGQTPIYQPTPSFPFALRQGGWDQAVQTPFDTKVYLTYPGYTEGETIPSGNMALAFTEGTFTIPSGGYVYSSNIIVQGAALVVCDATSDGAPAAGKLKYSATMAFGVIGFTEKYDAATGKLTVRVE